VAKAKAAKLDPAPLIYVDTSVYIDLITKEPTPHPRTGESRWKIAKALLDAVNDDRVTLAASALVDAEIGCFGLFRDGGEEISNQVRGWLDHPKTKYLEIDRFLARDATRLARTWHSFSARSKKLSGADALHLAAAIRLGSGYLMTCDGGFPLGQTVEGVEITLPEQVWQPTLLDSLETD
jgi:predicted nucleic acid-binding protein